MRAPRSETVLNYAFLGIASVFVLVPVLWFVLTALSPERSGFITGVRLENFVDAWAQADLNETLVSSVVITVGAVVLQALLAILGGYAFGVLGVFAGRIIFPIVLLGLMVSYEAIIVPLYYELRSVGLTDSWLGMILIHAGTSVPFGIFWMRAVFRSGPPFMVEAAEIDGANTWQTLWRVLVPIARPGILTLCLLNFMWTWNDYFLSLIFLSTPSHTTATVALGNFQGVHSTDVNLLAAASLIVSAPVVLLYLFFQRHIIHGIISGALRDS